MEFTPAGAKGKGTAVNKDSDRQLGEDVFNPVVWLWTVARAFIKAQTQKWAREESVPGKKNLGKTEPRSASLVTDGFQMACRWEKCGSAIPKWKARHSREEAKAKEKQEKEERGRRINSIFRSAPCIPQPPCGPRAHAHVSTLVRICFCYYMIGCGENIGKLYVRWEGGQGEEAE